MVQVSQRVNGGQWVSLGVFSFDAGDASILLSDNADGVVIADAVRLVYSESPPPPPSEIIVDDVDAVFAGTWFGPTTTTSGYYGTGYRYRTAGTGSRTATWGFTIPTAGSYEVYAWWTSGANRATNAPYTVNHAGGSSTVRVSQRVGGGSWQSLGVYSFDTGSASVRLSDDADGVVIADAIRLIETS